ncbi:MAG: transcription antitermination factor NusB [Deltaproteobacteria bacterium]|nr:transcription antitermination factor NusB [Deltaproteobacteria bacterium]
MGLRRKGRELALQALYQLEVTAERSDGALQTFWDNFEAGEGVKEFARALVAGVADRRADIDALIAKACENWRMDRLSKVDLSALRLATYELLGMPETPVNVVINEAIEIVRRYGAGESTAFVNGVLDRIAAELGVKPAAKDCGPATDQ